MASKMAELIQVHRDRDRARIVIDGEEFPYFTTSGWDIHVQRDHTPSVRITILADRVEVTDDIAAIHREPDEAGKPVVVAESALPAKVVS